MYGMEVCSHLVMGMELLSRGMASNNKCITMEEVWEVAQVVMTKCLKVDMVRVKEGMARDQVWEVMDNNSHNSLVEQVVI